MGVPLSRLLCLGFNSYPSSACATGSLWVGADPGIRKGQPLSFSIFLKKIPLIFQDHIYIFHITPQKF